MNEYMEILVKETVTLHKVLSRYLAPPIVEVSAIHALLMALLVAIMTDWLLSHSSLQLASLYALLVCNDPSICSHQPQALRRIRGHYFARPGSKSKVGTLFSSLWTSMLMVALKATCGCKIPTCETYCAEERRSSYRHAGNCRCREAHSSCQLRICKYQSGLTASCHAKATFEEQYSECECKPAIERSAVG